MSAVFFIMCRNQVLSPVDSLVNLCLVVGTESPYRDAVSMAILRLHEAATADSPGGQHRSCVCRRAASFSCCTTSGGRRRERAAETNNPATRRHVLEFVCTY